jgi:hypothetical protein
MLKGLFPLFLAELFVSELNPFVACMHYKEIVIGQLETRLGAEKLRELQVRRDLVYKRLMYSFVHM